MQWHGIPESAQSAQQMESKACFPTLRNLLMHVMLKAKIGRSEFQSLAVSSRAFAPARAASRVQREIGRAHV